MVQMTVIPSEPTGEVTLAGISVERHVYHCEAVPWHHFDVSHTKVPQSQAAGIINDDTSKGDLGNDVSKFRTDRATLTNPVGKFFELSLPFFSLTEQGCSPVRPGKGHLIRDAIAKVQIDEQGSIHVFTAAATADRKDVWDPHFHAALSSASSSEDIISELCFKSAASIWDAYCRALKPLLGRREPDAKLDDPCGILDALDSHSLEIPKGAEGLGNLCRYLEKMRSAANYLERAAEQLEREMKGLTDAQWVTASALSTSVGLIGRVISGLKSIQVKAEGSCSRLEGSLANLRDQSSASRDNLNNVLATGGIVLALLPSLTSSITVAMPPWVANTSVWLGAAGIAAFAVAYLRPTWGRKSERVLPDARTQ